MPFNFRFLGLHVSYSGLPYFYFYFGQMRSLLPYAKILDSFHQFKIVRDNLKSEIKSSISTLSYVSVKTNISFLK